MDVQRRFAERVFMQMSPADAQFEKSTLTILSENAWKRKVHTVYTATRGLFFIRAKQLFGIPHTIIYTYAEAIRHMPLRKKHISVAETNKSTTIILMDHDGFVWRFRLFSNASEKKRIENFVFHQCPGPFKAAQIYTDLLLCTHNMANTYNNNNFRPLLLLLRCASLTIRRKKKSSKRTPLFRNARDIENYSTSGFHQIMINASPTTSQWRENKTDSFCCAEEKKILNAFILDKMKWFPLPVATFKIYVSFFFFSHFAFVIKKRIRKRICFYCFACSKWQ